jgi:hypothetical protein
MKNVLSSRDEIYTFLSENIKTLKVQKEENFHETTFQYIRKGEKSRFPHGFSKAANRKLLDICNELVGLINAVDIPGNISIKLGTLFVAMHSRGTRNR